MKNVIHCSACGHALTPPLAMVGEAFVAEYEDERDVVAAGLMMVSDDSFADRFMWFYITNIADATGTRHHPDQRRLMGCCGCSDGEGPNLICGQCEAEVGSEMSDCWVPHMNCFDPHATVLRECP